MVVRRTGNRQIYNIPSKIRCINPPSYVAFSRITVQCCFDDVYTNQSSPAEIIVPIAFLGKENGIVSLAIPCGSMIHHTQRHLLRQKNNLTPGLLRRPVFPLPHSPHFTTILQYLNKSSNRSSTSCNTSSRKSTDSSYMSSIAFCILGICGFITYHKNIRTILESS